MKERVCKRFISMPDSDKPERLEIVQAANGKYFNHYGMDAGHWCANAGAFDTLWQAIEVLKKHRPDVVEKWWYKESELQAVREHLNTVNLNDYDLGGVEITEYDIEAIARRVAKNMIMDVDMATHDQLCYIRMILDDEQ